MKKVKTAVLLIVLVIASSVVSPAVTNAAAIELTASIKASFDKTAASADGKTAALMSSLYNALRIYQEEERKWEAKIKALHYQNTQTLLTVNKQIRAIDADKLSKLAAEVKRTKDRYKPLFTGYTAINKQIYAARKLKNKNLSAMLRAQADAMKLPIQLARRDIDVKEDVLKAAKDSASRRIKTLRAGLEDIDPVNVQIRAQRSAASLPKKSLSPVWSNFKYAIKKSDVKRTFDALETLVHLSRQIVQQQQKIYALENKVKAIIAKVKAQIPAG